MVESDRTASPMALAGLALVNLRATAEELAARFAAAGVELEPGVAAKLLVELEALGLVEVARGAPLREYAVTALGRRLITQTAPSSPLTELETLRTDLLSVIAHELRTPITVMRTLTGLLLDPASEPTPEQRRSMVQTMERNAERMQELIGDILDLARYRSGSISLQLRRFDATELAEAAIATIRPLAVSRGQTIDLQAPPTLAVVGDRPRLDRALLNLLANAHKFAPDGGRINVRVEATGDGTICWSVSDNGPGIPVADRDRLFERFFVGRRDTREGREGVGLGLPRAMAIAQAHGGTIDVRSRVGRGSTFKLIVPADGPAQEA